jgi:hypothetical protein
MSENLVEIRPAALGQALIVGVRMHRVLQTTIAAEETSEILAHLKALNMLHEEHRDILVACDEGDFVELLDPLALDVALRAALSEAVGKTVDMAKLRASLAALVGLFGMSLDKKKSADDDDDDDDEEAVEVTGELVEFSMVESWESGAATIEIEEGDKSDENIVLLQIEAIQPGWGNERDNHYYSKKLLKAYAPAFVGAKMFETNHVPGETNNRTWVSTILTHDGFSEVGAPIYTVGVHRPEFAETVRNLANPKIAQLDKLACSIRARGKARPGKVGEKKGNIVEEISKVVSVDWVAFAGAGGKATGLTEQEQESDAPVFLAEEAVTKMLQAASLAPIVRARLAERPYLDEQAVKDAILQERQYISSVMGAGRPAHMGETSATQHEPTVSFDEVERRRDEVNAKHLRRFPGRN